VFGQISFFLFYLLGTVFKHLFITGTKNITLNCCSPQKPLVVQTAISWKNQSAKISFLPGASQFKQKKNLFILLMLAPSRYLK